MVYAYEYVNIRIMQRAYSGFYPKEPDIHNLIAAVNIFDFSYRIYHTTIMSVARSVLRQSSRVSRASLPRPSRLFTPLFVAPLIALRPQSRSASTIPPRSEKFTTPTAEHITHLRSLLSSASSLLTTIDGSATEDDLAGFNNDWMNKYHGKSKVVIKPKSTKEVSEVMRYCYSVGLAVCPQGGNTGLVGMSYHPIDATDVRINTMVKLICYRRFKPDT